MNCCNEYPKIPIGYLPDGVFPKADKCPIEYLYFRSDRHLYLYRTWDKIETDLTLLSAYDNNVLFGFSTSGDYNDLKFEEYTSVPIDQGSIIFEKKYVKPKREYSYILFPVIYNLDTILVNDVIVRNIYNYVGVYQHGKYYYYVYRSGVPIDVDPYPQGDFTIKLILDQVDISEINAAIEMVNQLRIDIQTQLNQFEISIQEYINNVLDQIALTIQELIDEVNKKSNVFWKEGGTSAVNQSINHQIIRGTYLQIQNTPVVDKQFLLQKEDGIFYVDSPDGRKAYGGTGSGGGLLSDTIRRIEVVDTLPTNRPDDTLYIRTIPYEDGIDYMVFDPPFRIIQNLDEDGEPIN